MKMSQETSLQPTKVGVRNCHIYSGCEVKVIPRVAVTFKGIDADIFILFIYFIILRESKSNLWRKIVPIFHLCVHSPRATASAAVAGTRPARGTWTTRRGTTAGGWSFLLTCTRARRLFTRRSGTLSPTSTGPVVPSSTSHPWVKFNEFNAYARFLQDFFHAHNAEINQET